MDMTEMEIINERIDGVEGKIENIDSTVTKMNTSVGQMVILLRGNEFDKYDKGMIGKHNEMEGRLERLEKFKDRAIWVLVTAAAITGLNIFQLIDLVIKAFKHKP